MQELKVGDVVQLKSNGMYMTVNRVGPFDDPNGYKSLPEGFVDTIYFTVNEKGQWQHLAHGFFIATDAVLLIQRDSDGPPLAAAKSQLG